MFKTKLFARLLARSSASVAEPELDNEEDIDSAVLHILNPHFRASDVGVQIGSTTQKVIDRERSLIQKYRVWLQTQSDKQIIKAYTNWLNYYERNCNEAQKAIFDGAKHKWELESRKSRDEYFRISKLSRTIPKPEGL